MAADWKPAFHMLLLLLVDLSDGSSLTTSQQVSTTHPNTSLTLRPHSNGPQPTNLNSDDYEDAYADDTVPTREPALPGNTDLEPCDYDPCQQDQIPCHLLSAQRDCLCPGLTSYLEVPDPPSLMVLSQEGSEVVVQWCAPSSPVSSYLVTVDEGNTKVFGQNVRRGSIGEVPQGVKVCVLALNDSGLSDPAGGSCATFQPSGKSSTALKAGLIGGALGFLLLLSLALLLWRLRARRKAGTRISTHDTLETF
ncbi:LRRN4 C-terminal-like protein [Osmerus mordax]|uniref:LRRN4 C-terminal-like protein n=1 Tax=Osmerus mordax TaxID=8014 RepID=UPI00350FA2B8